MSLVNLANVCSHLQNASKARLGVTSVPASNLVLRVMLGLHSAGFLSYVVRGGPEPPVFASPTSLVPEPALTTTTSTVGGGLREGGREREREGEGEGGAMAEAAVTQVNVASRRLWLGLKYWDNEPVLRRMSLVSRPTRRTWVDVAGLERLVRGRTTSYVRGLTHPGECIFVTTDRGVMEARECIERKIGGMLLCRVL